MLEVICGPMFSGKSEELLRRAELAKIAGLDVMAYKPMTDTRSQTIKSRSGFEMPAYEVTNIMVGGTIPDAVVIIDEAQFFDSDMLLFVVPTLMSLNRNRVIISGLDMDFQGNPFGPMPQLLAMANKVTKLTAVCHACKSFDACYTQRIVNGLPTLSGEQILIGDNESYEARCFDCWNK